MLKFFRRKKNLPEDFGFLHTDVHSHLIPGIDDGAKTLSESISLIKELKALGFRKIITTPHINKEYFPNTREVILAGLESLRAVLEGEKIDIPVDAAAEYFMDEHFESLLEAEELLPLKDSYVLVEMSFFGPPPALEDYIFGMNRKGYRPVLAHPERYIFWMGKEEKYQRLRDMGCLFQMNILSLAGYYDRAVQQNAQALLKAKMIDLLGTDLHHDKHLMYLQQVLKNRKVMRLLSNHKFLNEALF